MDARSLALRGLERARALIGHPYLLNAVLVALLGWQLAGLTWQALPTVAAVPPPDAGERAPDRAEADQAPPAERLAQLSLFGRPPRPEGPELTDNAPETQLDLVLKGIYAAGRGAGAAVIAVGDSAEEVFAVGDRIADSAHITGIFPDRVMLRRGGQAEVLRLPADEAGAPQAAAEPQERESAANRG